MVTILASYVLLATITNAGYGEQTTYRAQFTDVAGLVAGDEVRIAGVRVGQVTDIGLTDDRETPMAEIGLEVASDVRLPTSVQATIRYRNLVGQRYVALTEGTAPAGRRCRPTTSSRSRRPSPRWT
ncbi:MlaD family protein [Klenkia terrae]|uniref:MlaD family protein n=1 Tax=Klenkia terrae TaxID=1052259 RepID=UPI00361A30E1